MKSFKLKHKNGTICWLSKEPIEFINHGSRVKFKDGETAYWNDYLHREDGPAIEYSDGGKQWWSNGKRHREDGPAIEHFDGSQFWYWHGEWLPEINSQEEFERWKRFKNFR